MATGTPKIRFSAPNHGRLIPASKLKGSVKFLIDANNRPSSTTSFQRSFPIRAVDSQTDEETPAFDEPNAAFIPQVSLIWLMENGYSSKPQILTHFNVNSNDFVFAPRT